MQPRIESRCVANTCTSCCQAAVHVRFGSAMIMLGLSAILENVVGASSELHGLIQGTPQHASHV